MRTQETSDEQSCSTADSPDVENLREMLAIPPGADEGDVTDDVTNVTNRNEVDALPNEDCCDTDSGNAVKLPYHKGDDDVDTTDTLSDDEESGSADNYNEMTAEGREDISCLFSCIFHLFACSIFPMLMFLFGLAFYYDHKSGWGDQFGVYGCHSCRE